MQWRYFSVPIDFWSTYDSQQRLGLYPWSFRASVPCFEGGSKHQISEVFWFFGAVGNPASAPSWPSAKWVLNNPANLSLVQTFAGNKLTSRYLADRRLLATRPVPLAVECKCTETKRTVVIGEVLHKVLIELKWEWKLWHNLKATTTTDRQTAPVKGGSSDNKVMWPKHWKLRISLKRCHFWLYHVLFLVFRIIFWY